MTEAQAAPGADAVANGEQVLRICILEGHRVIEERVLRQRGPVTIGTAEGNTFVLAGANIPKTLTLFEPKADRIQLILSEGLGGRLESRDGKFEFAQLREKAERQGSTLRYTMDHSAQGRIRVGGDVMVFFHFVPKPPPPAPVAIPAEMRGGFLRAMEPIFTAVLTASFLVHGAIAVFVWLTKPPEGPTVDDLKQLVERIQPPPKVDVPKVPITQPVDTGPATTGPGTDDKGDDGDGGGDPGGDTSAPKGAKGKGKGGAGGIGDRGAIRDALAGRGILQLIGGRGGGGGGGAVGSVFGSGAGVSDDIGSALQGTAGVGVAGVGGSGVTRRGTGGGGGGGDGSGGEGGSAAGIGDLATSGGGSVDTGAKAAARVVARVKADDVEAVDGKIDKKSVLATIRRRQDGFQACYETALKSSSKLQGKLMVEFTIGEGGKVTDARVVKDGLGSAEVSRCVVDLLKRLRFPAPSDGEVTIANSFVFQPGG